MNSTTVKQLSYAAFFAGVVSVIGSAIIYLRGTRKGHETHEHHRQNGLFVGLWAPTFFAISEMLDRLSIDDKSYLGIPIRRGIASKAEQVMSKAERVLSTR